MYLNYLSPYVRYAADSVINYPWILSNRVIFDYEILYLKKGTLDIKIENRSYTAQPGDIIFFKPGQEHRIELQDGCVNQPHVHFDMFYEENSPQVKISFKKFSDMSDYEKTLFRKDITSEGEMALPDIIKLKNTSHFEDMLFDIINEYNSKMPLYEVRLKSKLIELLSYLIIKNNEFNNKDLTINYPGLMDIKEYISRHTDSNLSLDELSELFNINRHHLIRQFKKVFYITPIHYHQMLRIEKAKEMIQYTDKSFTSIAEELGFTCLTVFSRAFKDIDGVAPSYYRVK